MSSSRARAEMPCPEGVCNTQQRSHLPPNATGGQPVLTMELVMRHPLRHFKSLIAPEKIQSQNQILQAHCWG